MGTTTMLGALFSMMGIELLVLIPFLLKYNKLDPSSKWMFYYILTSLIFSSGSWVLMKLFGNNMWFFNLMHFLQFVILSFFYLTCIQSPRLRYIIMWLPLVMLLIFSVDFIGFEGRQYYDSISTGIKSGLMIFYAISLFLQQLGDKSLVERSIYINSLPSFWYNSGLFLYFCTTILFSISMNLLQKYTPATKALQSEFYQAVLTLYSMNFIVGSMSMILYYIGLTKTKYLQYADS